MMGLSCWLRVSVRLPLGIVSVRVLLLECRCEGAACDALFLRPQRRLCLGVPALF